MARRAKAWEERLAEVDAALLELLERRAEIVRCAPKEELPRDLCKLGRRVVSRHRGGFPKGAVAKVFEEIGRGLASLAEERVVAFLGPEGTFTHEAALAEFGDSWKLMPCGGLEDIFHRVEVGEAATGVVPAENTIEGAVGHTLDLLLGTSLRIVGEVEIPIDHHLLSRAGSLEEVKEVFSHPQALGQCRQWLAAHLPKVTMRETSSTAEAAARARRVKHAAAIASRWAARRYALSVLASKIDAASGVGQNITRFLVLGREPVARTGRDKTSIAFSVRHEVGALVGMLQPFSRHGISLMKIESRPSREKPWEYTFFVDLEGHIGDLQVKRAVREVEESSRFLKQLGSYPRAAQ
ncbi:MAG: prephenate dehydratase [Nitrospinota bacterium]